MFSTSNKHEIVTLVSNAIYQLSISSKNRLIINISGSTCSGKSTLANFLKSNFADSCIIPLDMFFKNLNDVPKVHGRYIFDDTQSYDKHLYHKTLRHIINNEDRIEMPIYNLESNKRTGYFNLTLDKFTSVFICEGIYSAHFFDKVGVLSNHINIFTKADTNTLLKRRKERDIKLLNITEKLIEDRFNNCILPYIDTISKQQTLSQIVFNN